MKRITWLDYSVAGFFLSLSLLTILLNAQSPVARMLLRGERVSGLLIGSDYEDNTRHSDTLMYLSYDPSSRFLDVLSVPRDTQVSIPELPAVRRVNEIFAYEFRHSGRDFNISSMALKGYVETLLSSGSVTALRIPNYFTIDYSAFRALIDAMGGIYVRVTEAMNYDDNWGHLHIHFTPGTYLMNGHTALEYVRYRGGGNADQGRRMRQQIFIKDVLRRLKSPMVLWNLPHYAQVVLHGIHTNFSLWDLTVLLIEGRRMDWKNLRLFDLPGSPNGMLWKVNPEKMSHIVAMMSAPVVRAAPIAVSERNRASLETLGAPTVEVWNASSRPSQTMAVVQTLRDKGFDVVKYGPFKTRQARTLVLDRSGHLRPAQAVAEVLQAAAPEVLSRVDFSRQVDVSVILGNDAFDQGQKWGVK
jgi:LCP family protein required for cell wall assembly